MADDDEANHLDKPYREVKLAADGFVTTRERDGVTVSGACPRCMGTTSFVIPMGVPGGSGLTTRGGGAVTVHKPSAATVYCQCGFVHAGVPADDSENGCGAFWSVAID
jgi:hypothetical protein